MNPCFKKSLKIQTKLKGKFNSNGLFQDQGGCLWSVQELGNGVMFLNMYEFAPVAF